MRTKLGTVAAASLAVVLSAASLTGTPAEAAPSTGTIELLPQQNHQEIDGFGYATAFQRTTLVHALPADKQAEVLSLLLDQKSGAAPSILRFGIGSSATNTYDSMLSIQPSDPGGPTAQPKYSWDGWDGGQVWFAKEAKKRGVKQFYADAWSAPGYMKDNGTDVKGGTLCGLQGTTCASGDWRTAYAKYLVQYAKFYKGEGIKIGTIGFTNEPDYTTSYASMRFTPAQAAEFVKVLGPIAKDAGYGVACCDSYGWDQSQAYADAIRTDKEARKNLSVFTGHSYASRSDTPIKINKKVWMSEWAPSATSDGWNEAWDSSTPKVTDGLAVAQHISDTLSKADASAYLFWLGGSRGSTSAMLQIDDTNGTYKVSKRLYAFAAFSRYIRPGATRIGVDSSVQDLKASAYSNADGSKVVQLINTSTREITTEIDLKGTSAAYLTDKTHNVEPVEGIAKPKSGKTKLVLPPRSLVTIVQ